MTETWDDSCFQLAADAGWNLVAEEVRDGRPVRVFLRGRDRLEVTLLPDGSTEWEVEAANPHPA